jgi:hypothetical protein
MGPSGGAVLLVQAKGQLARASRSGALAAAAERDLRAAGFTVVGASARELAEQAARWSPVAVVLPAAVTWRAWRRWQADPRLRGVPVVVLARRSPDELLFPWPFGAHVRGDAFTSADDLARPGALAQAVRSARAGGRRRLTERERLGARTWYAGSALFTFALVLALAGVLLEAAAGRPPGAILVAAVCLGLGQVMMSVGGAAALGRPARLRVRDGLILIFVGVVTWVLSVR